MTPLLQEHNIRLLPLLPEHETVFMALANKEEISRWINKPFPYMQAHFKEQLETLRTQENLFIWMIEYSGELVGVINFASLREKRIFQGGYWIHPDHWGNGIAHGALILARGFLLECCGAVRIQALVEPQNPASMRVLEKAGYVKEGLLRSYYPSIRGGLLDVWMYAYVKPYWS